MIVVLLKGLIAGLVVGFVTASIRSWVDRFFLVIMLVSLLGLPIQEAILVNLIVVSWAVLMLMLRQSHVLVSVQDDWPQVILPAALGGALGRILVFHVGTKGLLATLGGYAILAGLRMLFVKPMPERDDPAHPAWIAPIAAVGGLLAGLLSAGGKPFTAPVYNAALGHHPRQAYALSTLGVVSGTLSAVMTQIVLGHPLAERDLLLAIYLFTIIGLTALVVERIWTPKLNRIVTLLIAPLLILVGARFLWMVLR